MLPCLTIGDSLAVGVGQHLPRCETEARVGITSQRFIHALPAVPAARQVVISLGVNDGPSANTKENLEALRRSVKASRVYWLLPAGHPRVRNVIREIAARHGDRLIDTAPYVGSDGLHPTGTGYAALARLTVAGPVTP